MTNQSPLRKGYISLLRNVKWIAVMHSKLIVWIFNIRLRRACAKADEMHRLTLRKYYVIPDWRGRPIALCIREIDLLKRKGLLKKSLSAYQLMKDAYYFTK